MMCALDCGLVQPKTADSIKLPNPLNLPKLSSSSSDQILVKISSPLASGVWNCWRRKFRNSRKNSHSDAFRGHGLVGTTEGFFQMRTTNQSPIMCSRADPKTRSCKNWKCVGKPVEVTREELGNEGRGAPQHWPSECFGHICRSLLSSGPWTRSWRRDANGSCVAQTFAVLSTIFIPTSKQRSCFLSIL